MDFQINLQIVDVEMPFDKTKNQRKGFCFITFESEQVANELLKTSKQTINGKEVINERNKKKKVFKIVVQEIEITIFNLNFRLKLKKLLQDLKWVACAVWAGEAAALVGAVVEVLEAKEDGARVVTEAVTDREVTAEATVEGMTVTEEITTTTAVDTVAMAVMTTVDMVIFIK